MTLWRYRCFMTGAICVVLGACTTVGRETSPRSSRESLAASSSVAPLSPEPRAGAPSAPHVAGTESPAMPSSFECPEVLLAARKGGSAADRYVAPTLCALAGVHQASFVLGVLAVFVGIRVGRLV